MTRTRSCFPSVQGRPRVANVSAIAMCALVAGCSATVRSNALDAPCLRQLHETIRSHAKLNYVTLAVRDGVAYLNGWVPNGAVREEARQVAAGVPCVREVWLTMGVGMYDHQ